MSLVRCYLHREKVILPTVIQAEEGFYLDSKPIFVYPLKDKASFRTTLIRTLLSSNNIASTPEASNHASSIILDELGLQKWSSFEKSAVMYTIFLGGRYATIYVSGRGEDGMWNQSHSRQRQFHHGLAADVLAEIIIDDMEKQPEAHTEQFSLALLPKKLSPEK